MEGNISTFKIAFSSNLSLEFIETSSTNNFVRKYGTR